MADPILSQEELTDDDLRYLRNLAPFNALTEEAFLALQPELAICTLPAGEALFRRGDMAPVSYYLLRGYVGLYTGSTEVDSIAAGSPTARFPLAHHLPREVTGRALTRCRYATINTGALNARIDSARDQEFDASRLNPAAEGDWMSRILRSPVFNRISAPNIQILINRMQEVSLRTGDVIIRQGDQGDYYYVIKTGTCEVVRRNLQGEETLLAKLGDGDSFGEEALLSGAVRSTTVVAASNVTLLRLRKDDFIELIKRPVVSYCNREAAISAVKEGALWLDVREQSDKQPLPFDGEVKRALLREIRAIASELPKDRQVIVVSEDGTNATTATFLLLERNISAVALSGGLTDAQSADTNQNDPAESDENELFADTEPAAIADVQKQSEVTPIMGSEEDVAKAEQVNQLHRRIADLQKALNTAKTIAATELVKSRNRAEALGAAEERVLQMESQLSSEREISRKLKVMVDRAENAVAAQQRELELRRGRLENKARQIGQKLKEMQAKTETAQNALAAKDQRIETLETVRESTQVTLEQLQKRLAIQNEEMAELQDRDEKTQSLLKEREWRVAELEAIIQQRSDGLESMLGQQSDNAIVQSLRAELELVRAQAEADVEELKKKLALYRDSGSDPQYLAS